MKILTVTGARPQFIKASAVSRVFLNIPSVEEVLLHTGQHYDKTMSDIFFSELQVPKPRYNLGVGSGSHGFQTGTMLIGIEDILKSERPDWVVVYGDTNSTLAAAIASTKLHIPIAHIEAGLRSWNRKMPEEINRVLTDHASDILFAPTQLATKNLINEGIDPVKVFLVGDVMYDVALRFAHNAEQKSDIKQILGIESRHYILATIHRAENTDHPNRLRTIFIALGEIAKNIPIIIPLHPRTRKALDAIGMLKQASETLQLIEPVGYLDMVALEKDARAILTDSGGMQKEAFFHRVPCGILRDETEWQELVDLGCNRLMSMQSVESIQADLAQLMNIDMVKLNLPNLYGNGHSAEKIVETLLNFSR